MRKRAGRRHAKRAGSGPGDLPGVDLAAVERAADDDRRWFLAHPGRQYRLRRFMPGEAPPFDSGDGQPYTIVRQLQPGMRQRIFHGLSPLDDDVEATATDPPWRGLHWRVSPCSTRAAGVRASIPARLVGRLFCHAARNFAAHCGSFFDHHAGSGGPSPGRPPRRPDASPPTPDQTPTARHPPRPHDDVADRLLSPMWSLGGCLRGDVNGLDLSRDDRRRADKTTPGIGHRGIEQRAVFGVDEEAVVDRQPDDAVLGKVE